jgi:hypothetical protein
VRETASDMGERREADGESGVGGETDGGDERRRQSGEGGGCVPVCALRWSQMTERTGTRQQHTERTDAARRERADRGRGGETANGAEGRGRDGAGRGDG